MFRVIIIYLWFVSQVLGSGIYSIKKYYISAHTYLWIYYTSITFCKCKWMCNIYESDPTFLCTCKRKIFFIVRFVMLNAFIWWAYQYLLLFPGWRLVCLMIAQVFNNQYALFNLVSLGLTLIETDSHLSGWLEPINKWPISKTFL